MREILVLLLIFWNFSIELKDEIDKERSNEALKRAQSRLKDKSMNQARANLALTRAKNRLKISSR